MRHRMDETSKTGKAKRLKTRVKTLGKDAAYIIWVAFGRDL